jgi:hypothetical protein
MLLAASKCANRSKRPGFKVRWMTWREISARTCRLRFQAIDAILELPQSVLLLGGQHTAVRQGHTHVHVSSQRKHYKWGTLGCFSD